MLLLRSRWAGGRGLDLVLNRLGGVQDFLGWIEFAQSGEEVGDVGGFVIVRQV